MKLVIVESPTKTKSLAKYLGKGYEVMATMGHIRDLPKSKMGIEVKKRKSGFFFVPSYELSAGKEETAKKLAAAAAKADKVILASDPDREGEAIAWHTQELLTEGKKGIKKDKIERITFHSITKEAIEEALKEPRKIDMHLVDAQQARRILDRLVGYELSPVLWKKVRRGLSAGRVQSVAVRLVVEREREIEAFKAEEYWEIKVEVTREKGKKEALTVELVKVNGKVVKIGDEARAREIEAGLNKAKYEVGKIEKKERHLYPHPPFKTSTLQQAGANVYGWSAKKTMSVAQRLYEKGAITYHRTDSLHLVESAVAAIREMIAKKYGQEYLADKEIYYKTSGKVVAQEAHEAIRPTHVSEVELTGEEVDREEIKLYQLIWRRTVACQMRPALVDQTVVWVVAENKDNYQLRAVGEIMKFESWKKLYKVIEEIILPDVFEEEKLSKEKVEAVQKFTLAPARYNDASLIKELEKRGIGRPSTYAPTISTIIVRGYVERKEKRFFATQIGTVVADFLVKNFPIEMEYEFTAKMEADLDEIAEGKKDWEKILSEFYGPFQKTVEKTTREAERVKMPVEHTGKPCPLCKEGEIVVRTGRFGRFYSCSRFPECRYTAKLIVYLEGMTCPKDGGRIVVKRTRTGREFYGCENYPKCDYASWRKPKAPDETEASPAGPGPAG
ncbi:MAG: type I DNA topoisomerase [Patescibacteria group bacterium]